MATFSTVTPQWKNVDYVGGWFLKAAQFGTVSRSRFAFVATSSLCQGQQVAILWQILSTMGLSIRFAVLPFKWRNLAKKNAGVTVVVVGLDGEAGGGRTLYEEERVFQVTHINPYLTTHDIKCVPARRTPLSHVPPLEYGVYYSKSAGLLLTPREVRELRETGVPEELTRLFIGSDEYIKGKVRYCLWIPDAELPQALGHPNVAARIERVRLDRLATADAAVNRLAERAHQFREFKGDGNIKLIVPIVCSEDRPYFPAGFVGRSTVPTNKAFFANQAPAWMLALVVSKLHLCWIATVCGRLEMRFSYSNTLGWNTFPVPPLTGQNKADLTLCAEEILLAREAHYPMTIAELYDPERMPANLREAHERNDETLERIYVGRKFRNDTERLEKLFEMYTRMTATPQVPARARGRRQTR